MRGKRRGAERSTARARGTSTTFLWDAVNEDGLFSTDAVNAGHVAGALSRTDVDARELPLRVCRIWQSLLRTSLVSAGEYRKLAFRTVCPYSSQFAVRQHTPFLIPRTLMLVSTMGTL